MALAALRYTFTVRDSEGHESAITLYRGAGATLADDIADGTGMQALIEALTLGIVARVEMTRVLDSADPGAVPAGDVENEIKGQFSFYNADGLTSQVSIPALDPATKLPNTDRLDEADAAVAAFVTEMVDGGWTDQRASDLVSLKAAYEAYTNRRRS